MGDTLLKSPRINEASVPSRRPPMQDISGARAQGALRLAPAEAPPCLLPAQERAWVASLQRAHGNRATAEMLSPRPVQFKMRSEPALSDATSIHRTAAEGLTGGPEALPHMAPIQQAFGAYSACLREVKAYIGGPALDASRAMGATAYTRGDAVAFGAMPDLHTAAHEAAHVIQQRSRLSLPGGVGHPGDRYERQADRIAELVVRGAPVERELDALTGGPGRGPGTVDAATAPVQLRAEDKPALAGAPAGAAERGLRVIDERQPVLAADRASFDALRSFIEDVFTRMLALVTSNASPVPWINTSNSNLQSLLSLLNQLVGDLRAERLIVRFDQPPGTRAAASYGPVDNLVHLRAFKGSVPPTFAADLVHEYTHVLQDRAVERLLVAGGGQRREKTQADDLHDEIAGHRQDVYFIKLLETIGVNVDLITATGDILAPKTHRDSLSDFEQMRAGGPEERKRASVRERQRVSSEYQGQLSLYPMPFYTIRLQANRRAELASPGVDLAPVDLGVVPDNIPRAALQYRLASAVKELGIFPQLFRRAGSARYQKARFPIISGGQLVGEFELDDPTLPAAESR